MAFDKLTIIDGNNLAWRVIHKYPPLAIEPYDGYDPAKYGLEREDAISIILGTLRSLSYILDDIPTDFCIVVWDAGIAKFRRELLPQYKNKIRPDKDKEIYQEMRSDLFKQTEILYKTILPIINVFQVKELGYEADDLIYEILRGDLINYSMATIVSTDQDYYQLVDDRIKIFNPLKKVFIDLKNFSSISHLPTPQHYLEFKILIGDPSDNIPHPSKLGEVSGMKLVEQYDHVYNMFSNDALIPRTKTRLRDYEEMLVINRNLIDLRLGNYKLKPSITHIVDKSINTIPCLDEKVLQDILMSFGIVELLSNYDLFIQPFKRLLW